ncbi:unnamed protein product [Echinostoma caproni]|uniref:Fe2OG dioxygenase domain-containing protein n=1 Tax=Echinostoma caproni TaxID=27848 RepID=A0A183B895_9TREM|nr:unnamed protein product [Echinostoma caproni]
MNRSGILLGEIPGSQSYNENSTYVRDVGGADIDLMSSLFDAGFQSILARLFPDIGPTIDSYRVFTVEYTGAGDASEHVPKDFDLSPHYDNSELTVNICLDFEPGTSDDVGGQLFFCHFSPRNNASWDRDRDGFAQLLNHRPGWAIVHRGSHVHGVLPFDRPSKQTRRRSLICWLRSSLERGSLCPRCSKPPQLEPMQVWYRGNTIDCTRLPPEAIENGDYVRVGFADGFLTQTELSCSLF